ncbi:MAG: UvrD-helicase domain-containing protein [candidate division KSB1 bacterium]|nr:UvrD-helicase domain-containing protein [candidate division KSB1 bacterium]MDZ7272486.1 UvrD-helicase domain-containing protein [candidate division KSB1 bacterium]MDZ7284490.1 UvrD-helicase domain-containing protein [candidate division KSB1 bacterium]MDZ7297114.1 UvrD-helicase domain-containing protein [candidate division KSB1 bacterium]MDZ7306562.1 UvrD-helicase domain-containing protein [candidate division KSB1 bacterium]
MKFYADLHLHSHYSRATSKQLNLEYLSLWAQLKGLTVVGTGDFVHPGWLSELREKLEPAETGLFRLKEDYRRLTPGEVPKACASEVRFLLTAEISNIYKRLDRVRKIHNIVFVPGFEAALKIQSRLESIGNIRADGRPILGLDSRDLLEIVLASDPLAFLVPAHIWTPWFSVLGSKGGFDAIDDCFADLTPHLFAVETGLSSDPPMNWRLKQLDRFVLVSNSDAHSPQKLAREANLFDTELSYPAIYRAWQREDDPGFLGTIEFFPEEGKYHFDGHRTCQTRLHPRETAQHQGNCPVCGKPVTVGVMARVEALADRPEGEKPPRWRPYTHLIPLPEIIAEATGKKAGSKGVDEIFWNLLRRLGNELHILQEAPLADIERLSSPVVAEGIRRMRCGEVKIAAGYDGEYGVIQLFTPAERREFLRQVSLVAIELTDTPAETEATANVAAAAVQVQPPLSPLTLPPDESPRISPTPVERLNPSQRRAVTYADGHLLIIAGPGTGKTHTLVHRIQHLLQSGEPARSMLAITFTNKAAEEMRQRLREQTGRLAEELTIGTFHAFCLALLREHADEQRDFEIIPDERREMIAQELWPLAATAERSRWLDEISLHKATLTTPATPEQAGRQAAYQAALQRLQVWDFDDLLLQAIRLLENTPEVRQALQQRYHWIFVDEYQDLNAAQHRLLKLLVQGGARLTAIGDPNQAIYGFRGAEVGYFSRFAEDFPGAVVMRLEENYRSGAIILAACGQVIEAGDDCVALPLSPTLLTPGNLTIYAAPTAEAEAEFVVHQIEKLVGGTSLFSQDSTRVAQSPEGRYSFGDFAILYRLNALRPPLEQALQHSGMPFQVAGETPLARRKGMPELLAVIRWAAGLPCDANDFAGFVALLTPGFGQSSAKKLAEYFTVTPERDRLLLTRFMAQTNLGQRPAMALRVAAEVMARFVQDQQSRGVDAALANLLTNLQPQPETPLLQVCRPNWQRLAGLAHWHSTPRALLDALALQREADQIEARAEKISLLTLHAAKGLEFPVVFIIGCEEHLTPMQLEELQGDPAEERRLFYVGMTRARERLYLVRAARRMLFGKSRRFAASRFLSDIEEQLKAYEYWQARAKKSNDQIAEQQLRLF